ncbi:MAG: hypothetical protein AAF997_00805 [Myxococcota bacterium]
MMRAWACSFVSAIPLLLAVGCGDGGVATVGGSAGAGGAGGSSGEGGADAFEATLEHSFDVVVVEPATDDYWCQSWTLDNDEPLYINKVRQQNDGAWHHSNWYFLPEGSYGDDGTWRCQDRQFTQARAVVSGGAIFAQSTQAFEETQAFGEGIAIVVPPRSMIIGDVHLFNPSAAPIETALTMGFATLDEQAVTVRLREVSFALNDIAIDPQRRSRWAQTCDLDGLVADSFNVYYVLGHYHEWGNYFKLSFVDDGGQETVITELENAGEVLGVTVDPPINSSGAKRLRYECGYNNTTDRTLTWGNAGEDEMCQFLAYIDGDTRIGAFPEGETPVLVNETDDGVLMYEVSCGGSAFGLPAND